ARDAGAGRVRRIAADLDARNLLQLEGNAGQGGGGFGRIALAQTVRSDPVAYLAGARADPRMQAGPADYFGLIRIENPVQEVLIRIEPGPKGPQQFDAGIQRDWFLMGPDHPRSQVRETDFD